MKWWMLIVAMLAASATAADVLQLEGINLHVREASATRLSPGIDSNRLALATAHLATTGNVHGVTAADLGALTNAVMLFDQAGTNLYYGLLRGTGTVFQVARAWRIVIPVGLYGANGTELLHGPTNYVSTLPYPFESAEVNDGFVHTMWWEGDAYRVWVALNEGQTWEAYTAVDPIDVTLTPGSGDLSGEIQMEYRLQTNVVATVSTRAELLAFTAALGVEIDALDVRVTACENDTTTVADVQAVASPRSLFAYGIFVTNQVGFASFTNVLIDNQALRVATVDTGTTFARFRLPTPTDSALSGYAIVTSRVDHAPTSVGFNYRVELALYNGATRTLVGQGREIMSAKVANEYHVTTVSVSRVALAGRDIAVEYTASTANTQSIARVAIWNVSPYIQSFTLPLQPLNYSIQDDIDIVSSQKLNHTSGTGTGLSLAGTTQFVCPTGCVYGTMAPEGLLVGDNFMSTNRVWNTIPWINGFYGYGTLSATAGSSVEADWSPDYDFTLRLIVPSAYNMTPRVWSNIVIAVGVSSTYLTQGFNRAFTNSPVFQNWGLQGTNHLYVFIRDLSKLSWGSTRRNLVIYNNNSVTQPVGEMRVIAQWSTPTPYERAVAATNGMIKVIYPY